MGRKLPDRHHAISELTYQVHQTELFVGKLFLINANGKCPATTGCGPFSEANAQHIATFDPPTAIALLDRLTAAEAENAALRKALEWYGDPYGKRLIKTA